MSDSTVNPPPPPSHGSYHPPSGPHRKEDVDMPEGAFFEMPKELINAAAQSGALKEKLEEAIIQNINKQGKADRSDMKQQEDQDKQIERGQ